MKLAYLPIGDWSLAVHVENNELYYTLYTPQNVRHEPAPQSLERAIETALPDAPCGERLHELTVLALQLSAALKRYERERETAPLFVEVA